MAGTDHARGAKKPKFHASKLNFCVCGEGISEVELLESYGLGCIY